MSLKDKRVPNFPENVCYMSDSSSFLKFPPKLHIAGHHTICTEIDPPTPTSAFLRKTFQQLN